MKTTAIFYENAGQKVWKNEKQKKTIYFNVLVHTHHQLLPTPTPAYALPPTRMPIFTLLTPPWPTYE